MLFARDKVPTTIAGLLWELKELLVSAGWTVTRSSDGTTYNSSGDELTTETDLSNDQAWFAVRSPDGREWCWQTDDPATDPHQWRVKYSRAAGFSGGSPGSTQTPLAIDEHVLVGGGTDAAPTFQTITTNAPGALTLQASAEQGGRYGWWMVVYATNTAPVTLAFQDPMVPGSYAVEDTDPVVVGVLIATDVITTTGLQTSAATKSSQGLLGASLATVRAANWQIGSRVLPAGGSIAAVPNPFNGKTETAPMLWFRPNSTPPEGWKGESSLFRWNGGSQASGSRATIRATHDHVVFGMVVFQWDGGAAPANQASAVDFAAHDLGRAAPFSGLHSVTPTAGTALGATFEAGRWTPIGITVRRAADAPVLIWGKLQQNAYAWQVVYHSGAGGFAPLFATTSTVQAAGDELVFSLLPLGGWVAAPELYIGEFAEVPA